MQVSGREVPVKYSEASFAWATSIQRPFSQGMPSASASSRSWVRAGLYTTSSTPSRWENCFRSMGETPVLGYIPTGVALTMTEASV